MEIIQPHQQIAIRATSRTTLQPQIQIMLRQEFQQPARLVIPQIPAGNQQVLIIHLSL
jgi:hypothetical protein